MKLCRKSGYSLPPISFITSFDIAGSVGTDTLRLYAPCVGVVVAGEKARGVNSLLDVDELEELGNFF